MNLTVVGKDEKGMTRVIRLYGVKLLNEVDNEVIEVESLDLLVTRSETSVYDGPRLTAEVLQARIKDRKIKCVLHGFSRIYTINKES